MERIMSYDWIRVIRFMASPFDHRIKTNLTSPLVDFCYSCVTVMSFSWHLCDVSHPAMILEVEIAKVINQLVRKYWKHFSNCIE